MEKKELYTRDEIISIIDEEIRKTAERKNAYIEKNGFRDAAALNAFSNAICALLSIVSKF